MPDLTPDGRYLAYVDLTGSMQVRVHDRVVGTNSLVSVGIDGAPSEGPNLHPAISDDGRFVTWEASSDDGRLVPGVRQGVFLRDLGTGTTELVSVALDGTPGNDGSYSPAISADGRYVVFSSWATNLTADTEPTGWREVFRRDRVAGTTSKVSVANDGTPLDLPGLHPSVSDDGRFVVFESASEVVLRDMVAGTTEFISITTSGNVARGGLPVLSGDGRFVVFASWAALDRRDTNGTVDTYVRDRLRGTTRPLSLTPRQEPFCCDYDLRFVAPTISDDGHYAAFATEGVLTGGDANRIRDVFVRPAWQPSVTSVTPNVLARGTTARLVLTADGLQPGAGANLNFNGPGGVTVTNVELVSSGELRVDVTVAADAPLGPRTVMVWNPALDPTVAAGTFGFCVACVSVT
jgi:Tol biopolymer transport system component